LYLLRISREHDLCLLILISNDPSTAQYVDAVDSERGISRLSDIHLLDNEGKQCLAKELADKADWLELKPNFFGLGINLNQIIRDIIKSFKGRAGED
jgi:hypothetical protein